MVSVENERVRRKYFKDLNRKVYIERALESIRDEGTAVSYTHLDVYKRQGGGYEVFIKEIP